MSEPSSPVVALVHALPRYPVSLDESSDYPPVLAALRALGLDPQDPFAGWIGPGATVVLKPNWVRDRNPNGHDLDSLVTHPSVIFTLADRAARALHGRGTIVIGDAPLQSCAFDRLLEQARIPQHAERLQSRYPDLHVRVEDWRLTLLDDGAALTGPMPHDRGAATGATDAFALIDLGTESFFEEIAELSDRFRVTCYRPSLMRSHHGPGKHEYLVSRRVLDADLVINIPKFKTHIKAGLTGALKNLVGINGHKEFLPHHTQGAWEDGGDCYLRRGRFRRYYDRLYDYTWEHLAEFGPLRRSALMNTLGWMTRINDHLGDGISTGSWSGNDTIWRMTLDLNHVLYRHARGRVLHFVDGIVAGQGEGPLQPEPHQAGVVLAGDNPAHVDAVLARLGGYNIARLPTVYHALTHSRSIFAGLDPRDIPVLRATTPDAVAEPARMADLPDLELRVPAHWRRAKRLGTQARVSSASVASGDW